jgi:hypothetical protein
MRRRSKTSLSMGLRVRTKLTLFSHVSLYLLSAITVLFSEGHEMDTRDIQEGLNRLRDKRAPVARAIAAVQYLKLEYRDTGRQQKLFRGDRAPKKKIRKPG